MLHIHTLNKVRKHIQNSYCLKYIQYSCSCQSANLMDSVTYLLSQLAGARSTKASSSSACMSYFFCKYFRDLKLSVKLSQILSKNFVKTTMARTFDIKYCQNFKCFAGTFRTLHQKNNGWSSIPNHMRRYPEHLTVILDHSGQPTLHV